MDQRGSAQRILQKALKECQSNPSQFFSCGLIDDDLFRWRITIIGQQGTNDEGGMFPCEMIFPPDYPNKPPSLFFRCPMFHPNIRKEDGHVCISILHECKHDEFNEMEKIEEKWKPVYTVEGIIIAVLLMLNEPNQESPENVEANRVWMTDKKEFWRNVRRCAANSITYC